MFFGGATCHVSSPMRVCIWFHRMHNSGDIFPNTRISFDNDTYYFVYVFTSFQFEVSIKIDCGYMKLHCPTFWALSRLRAFDERVLGSWKGACAKLQHNRPMGSILSTAAFLNFRPFLTNSALISLQSNRLSRLFWTSTRAYSNFYLIQSGNNRKVKAKTTYG